MSIVEQGGLPDKFTLKKIDTQGRLVGKPRVVRPGLSARLGPGKVVISRNEHNGLRDIVFDGDRYQSMIEPSLNTPLKDLDSSLTYQPLARGQSVKIMRLDGNNNRIAGLSITRLP